MSTQLMDIGEHCVFCGKIDFLPFKCACKGSFCQEHRRPESHGCSAIVKKNATPPPKENSFKDLPSSQSLFPDRSKWQPPVLKTTESHPTNLGGQLTKENKSSALYKLKNFFNKHKKSTKPATNPSKRIVEISKLKQQAKGDDRVPASERIHVWVQIIDEGVDKELKHPLFISRGWPIGRGLDAIAQQLGLKNINNRTNDANEKLFLFKVANNEFVKLNTGDRCSKLQTGDTLYLVRGEQ